EPAVPQVVKKRVPEHEIAGAREQLNVRQMTGRLRLLERRTDLLHHVGMHIGDEDVHAPVVVEVEELDAHRTERRSWKILARLIDEALAADVLIVVLSAR